MIIRTFHPWNVSYQQAVTIQEELRNRIVLDLPFPTPNYVAGVDVSTSKTLSIGWAAVVVLSFPELRVVEQRWAEGTITFPYIPGLLSFREIPLVCKAIEQLSIEPDVFLCDGQGLAHPRRMGIATHLGVIINKPTVGCAKSRLIGTHEEVGSKKGAHTPLMDKKEVIGAVLRTRQGVKPVFVSPGYGISLKVARTLVLSCVTKYRIPEPIRAAHNLVTLLRNSREAGQNHTLYSCS